MFARLRCGGNLPMLRPGVDRPLRGNCHPLSCAPDNQVRCVFGSAPYQKPPSMVRNMHAVLKKASWGTRRIFISIRCKKQASTVRNTHSVLKKASSGTRRIFRGIRCKKQAFPVRKGYSVRKTASWGTRCVFKGAQNSTCYIERIFKGPQNSRLHRLWTASCSSGSSFSARHGLREEVSRQKKVVTIFRDHFFDM